MRLTVLGRSAACPNPGGACSGYLVEQEDMGILLDCGTGVVSRLREVFDYRKIAAVIISHMHADHFIDLIPYIYGLKIMSGLFSGRKVPLYLPPGGTATLNSIISNWKDLPSSFTQVFEVSEYDPAELLQIGSVAITFTPTVHYIPAWAVRIAAAKTLVFTGDTGPSDAVVDFAVGADMLLAEAAYQEKLGVPGEHGHLTPREAGEIARRANVSRLVLTHFWQEFDQTRMVREASETFGGPVDLAEEWKTYTV